MSLRTILLSAALLGSSLCCQAESPSQLDTAVRAFMKEGATPGYRYAQVDLNGDGQADALVLLEGDYCGYGGCTLLVLRASPSGFALVSSTTISNEPIGVINERRHGWKTLLVTSRGVGPVLMRLNGAKYPTNPSLQTAATKEQAASATILKFESGVSSGG